ncbi:MAG: hypothetical protein KDK36_17275, partial [Leptospiraceae bacterium]|nr:hypothetical protein [Leptospiraceae bacterium]
MSGINPTLLQSQLINKNLKISFFPRPSEQAEGIFALLISNFKNKNLEGKKFFINISPITFTENGLFKSHKTLYTNYWKFDSTIMLNKDLNKFYLKTMGGNIKYMLSTLFPSMKLKHNIQSEFALIPFSAQIDLNSNLLSYYLDLSIKYIPKKELNQNMYLREKLQESKFYWNWGKFYENKKEDCKHDKILLDKSYSLAFSLFRKDSLKFYNKIIQFIIDRGGEINFVYIPFSPYADEIF